MKRHFTLLILLITLSISGYSKVWIVNNSGFTFSPSTLTITEGDTVNFVLTSSHNSREVSESTWLVNGNAPLPGGWETPFGGGMVLPDKLTVGTHWYVCSPHASDGMKGIIIVETKTGTKQGKETLNTIRIYPNPIRNLMNIDISSKELQGVNFLIADQKGIIVYQGQLKDENTLIDVSDLAKGGYLLQVQGLRRQHLKFIKH